MTKSPVPLGTNLNMAQYLQGAWPTPSLTKADGGAPRTILITRGEAGADQADACVAAFLLTLPRDRRTVVAHVGGPAGAAYRSHPENLRKRYDTVDEDFVAKLCDWRYSEVGSHNCVAIFDPQLNPRVPDCVGIWQGAYPAPLPVDLIYVAISDETRMAAARTFAKLGLNPIISQRASVLRESDQSRLDFPRLPPDLKSQFDEGGIPFADLLEQASPATRWAYIKQAQSFAQRFKELSLGR